MAQEICNRTSKDIVRGMGANKTRKAMMRASKASAGVRQIVQQLQDTTKIKKTSQAHRHRNKEDDEILMLQDLQKLKPFELSPGRYHRHFQDMHVSPASTVDMTKLFGWLEKHKKQIARGQFISVGTHNSGNEFLYIDMDNPNLWASPILAVQYLVHLICLHSGIISLTPLNGTILQFVI